MTETGSVTGHPDWTWKLSDALMVDDTGRKWMPGPRGGVVRIASPTRVGMLSLSIQALNEPGGWLADHVDEVERAVRDGYDRDLEAERRAQTMTVREVLGEVNS